MNKFFRTAVLILVIIGGLRFFTFYTYTYDGMNDENFQMLFNEKYNIFALNLPENITFAGEAVPFQDPEIYERFDREMLVNTYWQSQSMLFFKRANRYFKIIEPILKQNGVPDDFKYLAVVESSLTNVVSPAGAAGFWQILEGTGKNYGLEIDKEVDERYSVAKATQAACQYLKEAHKEFGTWTLAAASYNMGINGLRKQLDRQEGKSYYDLTLNDETARYLFRIIAVKELLENPEKYGYHFRQKDLYHLIPTHVVVVDTAVTNFGKFAEDFGINYRILKYHNPWLRYDYLPNPDHKKYYIKIPKKGYYELSDISGQMPPEDNEDQDSAKVAPPAISDTTQATRDTIE